MAILAAAVLFVVHRIDHARIVEGLPPTPPSPTNDAGPNRTVDPSSRPHHTKPASHGCSKLAASPFGGSYPVEVCVPQIGVDATVLRLGLNPDRTVQVPALSQVRDAGWYEYSSAPGKRGPMVILGHVDSAQYGEGVFFELGRLRAGDQVKVTRANGSIVTYDITAVREVSKTAFPTQSVYGDTRRPTIRLITCGGTFDSATGNYLSNIIAYGTLHRGARPRTTA